MIKLTQVTVNKYKSIQQQQTIDIDKAITVFVGMNESGKTAFLESIAKTNYFTDDKKFKFNPTYDFPKNEDYDEEQLAPTVVTCTYSISKELEDQIKDVLGADVLQTKEFSITTSYDNSRSWVAAKADRQAFLAIKIKDKPLDDNLKSKFLSVNSIPDIDAITAEGDEVVALKEELKNYFHNKWEWKNPIEEYIAREMLTPRLPKFLYYDEFYLLPSEINIRELKEEQLEEDELKTSKALFELAKVNIDKVLGATEFEEHVSRLERTSNSITRTLFNYWTTNQNLGIQFKIESKLGSNNAMEHILHIRVENKKYNMTLPLKNRSKGFNWFFSFIVWFSKIQEDKDSNYMLLLDEPGLNLHASAQADLLKFIDHLAEEKGYQIMYTTHSPFMIESNRLDRVRTVVETDDGTKVSDSIQERDPNTLFPLQAALGYDIAQNLFVSKNNLLVEGPADLLYLTIMSDLLAQNSKKGLREDITIVPVGGLDKVVTFISLLRGSKLNVTCLLDTPSDGSKQKVDDLIRQKIIKATNVKYFNEFATTVGDRADIEDLFEKSEYLKIFNEAFKDEYSELVEIKLNKKIKQIIPQINSALSVTGFNHYRPSSALLRMEDKSFIGKDTLARYEELFRVVNALFPT